MKAILLGTVLLILVSGNEDLILKCSNVAVKKIGMTLIDFIEYPNKARDKIVDIARRLNGSDYQKECDKILDDALEKLDGVFKERTKCLNDETIDTDDKPDYNEAKFVCTFADDEKKGKFSEFNLL